MNSIQYLGVTAGLLAAALVVSRYLVLSTDGWTFKKWWNLQKSRWNQSR